MTNLIVRNVDKRVFHEFKSEAVREGVTIGKAITMAMFMWIERERKTPKRSILDLKPVSYKSRKASAEIDKEVYGG